MITKVLNERGEILHDCMQSGCDVSWDGYAIRPHTIEQPDETNPGGPPKRTHLSKGDALPGRNDPDTSRYTVTGSTAKLRG